MKEMTPYPASLGSGRPHMCTYTNSVVAGDKARGTQVEKVSIHPHASLAPPSLSHSGWGPLTTPSCLSLLLLVLF